MNIPNVVLTPENFKGQKLLTAFAKACGGKIFTLNQRQQAGNYLAIYGFLYGQEEVIKQANEYWHIDHGFFGRSNPVGLMNGYYRIIHNDVYFDHNRLKSSWDKFHKFKLRLKDWNSGGRYILLVPPTKNTYKHLGFRNINDWTNNVISEIKKYSDRQIQISTKDHPIPLSNEVWCLVTAISNIQVDALISGIPVITTHSTKIGKLADIESPIYNRDILAKMACQQWTLKEIESGIAWKELNE